MREVGVGGKSFNRLDGEIGIVSEGSRKIICTELVLGIESLVFEILCPAGQLRPEALCKPRIAFGTSQSVDEDKHVPAFLDGHLVLFSLFAATVHLPIRQWILTEIMRRERKPPASKSRVFKYGEKLCLKQLWLQEQEQRGRRVDDVYGGDAAVRRVFLGKHQRIAIEIGGDFVCGE